VSVDSLIKSVVKKLQVKNEQCIILRTKEGKIVLTNSDEIGLKEWSVSLRTTLKCSKELLSGLPKKAGTIYGTTDGTNHNSAN
jgi:beta-adrenergic-receptor kinase